MTASYQPPLSQILGETEIKTSVISAPGAQLNVNISRIENQKLNEPDSFCKSFSITINLTAVFR